MLTRGEYAYRLRDMMDLLAAIVAADTDYERRELLVYRAIVRAKALGWRTGFRIDPAEPEWPVAYIELPTGQVSWHLPQYPDAWDGHTTEEKFARIAALALENE